MTFFSPKFVTETDESPPWTDCTWASGLMLANKASEGAYPATRAEREALRKASGDHFGGSTLQNLRDAIQSRYGWVLPNVNDLSWAQLLEHLLRGDGAVVQGLYSRLTPHFQRWDTHFAGTGSASGHAAYAQGHDRAGNQHISHGVMTDVFWCDPLGRSPVGTPVGDRYRGEWMPVEVLRRFMNGLASDADLYAATARQGSAS